MKSVKKNSIIILLVTLLIMFFVLKDNFEKILEVLLSANPFWLLVSILSVCIYIIFETLAFLQVVRSNNNNFNFLSALRIIVVTKFFNGITPFSTGGQPMQVYMMKEEGFKVTKATNIIIQNFILYQVLLIIYGIFAILSNQYFNFFKNNIILNRFIVLGFLINFFVMIFLILVSFSSKFNKFVVGKGILFLSKINIVKDVEKTSKKWLVRCEDFCEGAKELIHNKNLLFKGLFYNFMSFTFQYVTPLFIILALSKSSIDINVITTIIASAYVLIIGSFVPIPGATGGIEYGYLEFFGTYVLNPILSASLLLWRALTYYIPMIVGAIVFNIKKKV